MFTSGKFPVHQWKVSLCGGAHLQIEISGSARAPGLATVLQTTPVWEEQRGRPERRRAKSFTCRAGKGKKKRDRALPSESARRIATSAAHEFAKRVNLPNVFAKLLEMHFCPFCQFFKDAKCFLSIVGDALRSIICVLVPFKPNPLLNPWTASTRIAIRPLRPFSLFEVGTTPIRCS